MSGQTFADRMAFLARHEYPILTLAEAVQDLQEGRWPDSATVITIDDGWYGTYKIMGPILRKHRFPATLYLASYYLQTRTQVLNVAVNYALWRARDRKLVLESVCDGLTGVYDLDDDRTRMEARDALIRYSECLNGAEERQRLFRQLCAVLGLDATEIESKRICAFMGIDEARELQQAGIDIQLHTHRHRFPPDDILAATKEIEDNRRTLAPIGAAAPRRHFCYPSGEYEKQQLAWLQAMGIESATTTRAGFTRRGASPYELPRFLDSERVSPLEFEAEMCGFFELIRRSGYPI